MQQKIYKHKILHNDRNLLARPNESILVFYENTPITKKRSQEKSHRRFKLLSLVYTEAKGGLRLGQNETKSKAASL